jgi:transcriptional regulator with XRE-family HTH domain
MSSEEENNCFICWSSLDEKEFGRKKIIHNHEGSHDKWEHSCHEKCLNKWAKQCINSGEGIYPKCPVCNAFDIPIDKIHSTLRVRAQEILQEREEEQEEEEIEEIEEIEDPREEIWQEEPPYVITAREKLNNVHNRGIDFERPTFLGLMICYKGIIIKKFTDVDFNLTIDAPVGLLKEEILRKNKEISQAINILDYEKLSHNLNLKNWINWTFPKYRIADLYYGMPTHNIRFDDLASSYDLINTYDVTLEDMFLDYQTKIGNVYYKHNPAYFYDTINLPESSLSWLVVNVESV